MALRGFPVELTNIDFDRRVIRERAFAADGFHVGPATDKRCHFLQLHDRSQLQDLDGISGSPVFYLREASTNHYLHRFADVVTQDPRKSGDRVRFIHASVLLAALFYTTNPARRT